LAFVFASPEKDRIVTDGPFSETKELVAGYSIWKVKSMEEAIAWVKRCPMTDDSEVEIRPIFSYSPEASLADIIIWLGIRFC
jgi:hypothetical protein